MAAMGVRHNNAMTITMVMTIAPSGAAMPTSLLRNVVYSTIRGTVVIALVAMDVKHLSVMPPRGLVRRFAAKLLEGAALLMGLKASAIVQVAGAVFFSSALLLGERTTARKNVAVRHVAAYTTLSFRGSNATAQVAMSVADM
jgi:hypothetical protein